MVTKGDKCVSVAQGKLRRCGICDTSVGEMGSRDPTTGAVTPNIKVTLRKGGTIDAEGVAHEADCTLD